MGGINDTLTQVEAVTITLTCASCGAKVSGGSDHQCKKEDTDNENHTQ